MKNQIFKISLLLLFVVDMILVVSGFIVPFDNLIYSIVRMAHNSTIDYLFVRLTYLGNWQVIVFLLILFNSILNKKDKFTLDAVVLVSVISNYIIKRLVMRDRPSVLRLVEIGGYSFPSGHSMIAITLYGFLIYLIHKKVREKKLRVFLKILFGCLIFSVCISRIYVGVHFASDVIGGFLLGLFELLLVLTIRDKYFGGDSECTN